jgi:hypothetical protein
VRLAGKLQGFDRDSVQPRQLKHADKSLRIAVVGGGSCSTHRKQKAFLQKQMTSLLNSELLALIAVPDAARRLKGHGFDRIGDQICTHMVVKGHSHNRAGSFVQGEAASHA